MSDLGILLFFVLHIAFLVWLSGFAMIPHLSSMVWTIAWVFMGEPLAASTAWAVRMRGKVLEG